mgnify:CR=1 FL=1
MDVPVTAAERLQRIKVIGVGGGGSNAVKRMIEAGIVGVDFIAVNTSLKELKGTRAPVRLQIGEQVTHGLSTGGDVSLGTQAAEAATEQIQALLENTDMVFIAATLGGGTGTGAAPVIARIAKRLGILTVAVVTKPFGFEGSRKTRLAETGLQALTKTVDAEIVISNDRLLTLDVRDLRLTDAFLLADEMLHQSVQTVCDFVLKVGVINVDLRDCTDITFTGNVLFAPNPDNLHVVRGKRILVDGNAFNPREFERPGRLVFDECQDCIVSDNTLRALLAPEGAGADHLKALSRIARVLRDAETVAKIRGTQDATAIHTFLAQTPASHAA